MDNTLQIINREYIALPDDEISKNNVVLNEILETIIEKCRETDDIFKSLYRGLFYGGSYYEGLKIKRPDEYDIDVKLAIPYNGPIKPTKQNGYAKIKLQRVHAQIPKLWSRKHQCLRPYYGQPKLHQLADFLTDYLDTEKVMIWMHRVLSTSLGGWKSNKKRIAYIETISYGDIKVIFRRNGPAFTFRITGLPDGRVICLDLVPCFVFGAKQWPTFGFRPNPVPEKEEFFIVPKQLDKEILNRTQYWRLSFPEQERALLNKKENLKPALKLLKKMRDKLQQDDIKSYFIKTVFLWEVFKYRDDSFWNEPLSHVFLEVLKDYQQCITRKRIEFFWYPKFNLIGQVDGYTLTEFSIQLKNIIKQLENDPDNEVLVAKFLLSRKEMSLFMEKYLD